MATYLDSRSLRIQSVLFHQSPQELERLVRSLVNTIRRTRAECELGRASLHLGDCSPVAVLADEQLASLDAAAGEVGLDIEYRHFAQNLGHAGGQNRLLEGADEDLVLFVNPDAYTSPDLLLQLSLPLGNPRGGIIESRQIPLEHPKGFDSMTGATSWACMAGALVTRAAIDAVRAFDSESFFLYCDDVDFSWRVKLAGLDVVHQPTALIFHDKRLDTEGRIVVSDAEVYYAAEAAMMLAWKYSREDLAATWSAQFTSSALPLERQAADSFKHRQEQGSLPPQLDGERRVAQFHGTDFALHRFSYDD